MSLVCGGIALACFTLYNVTFDRFVASGFDYIYYELLFGGTVLAAPLVRGHFKFPGSAIIAGLIAGGITIAVGQEWNDISYYYVLIPGISYELAFLPQLFSHKFPAKVSQLIGAILTTGTSIIWDWSRNGYNHFPIILLVILTLIRLISILTFTEAGELIIQRRGSKDAKHQA